MPVPVSFIVSFTYGLGSIFDERVGQIRGSYKGRQFEETAARSAYSSFTRLWRGTHVPLPVRQMGIWRWYPGYKPLKLHTSTAGSSFSAFLDLSQGSLSRRVVHLYS
jgi:hypothetical protein